MSSEDEKKMAKGTGEVRVEPILEYLCHPAKKNRKITMLVTGVIIVCILLTYFITYSPFMTILGGMILFGALTGFYFPTRYSFYEDHIIIKTTTQALRKDWSLFRSYYPDKNGVLLSPFGRPTRMENFRGIFIKFADNRDEVMKLVESKIDFEDDE
ncbi:MAG: hypothetical protein KAR42_03270 [candidate division Zixibacteria bacterium]|nr:hypothetical protein [candidate division Zixibacteria bacterium]